MFSNITNPSFVSLKSFSSRYRWISRTARSRHKSMWILHGTPDVCNRSSTQGDGKQYLTERSGTSSNTHPHTWKFLHISVSGCWAASLQISTPWKNKRDTLRTCAYPICLGSSWIPTNNKNVDRIRVTPSQCTWGHYLWY